jgi:predicted HTH domain antitoxin
MKTLQIKLPDEILISLKQRPEELSKQIRVAAAMKLYEMGKLSSGRAAQLAWMSRIGFLQALGDDGVSMLDLTEEDLEQDLRNA